MPHPPYKIVLIGPESTGKTSLAKNLAAYYQTLWLPEYARSYVEALERPYTYEDVQAIACKQPGLEEKLMQRAKGLFFLDTDLLITKVWFDEVFGNRPEGFDALLKQYHGDFYLLCRPDLNWSYDPVREYPEKDFREYLFGIYAAELKTHNWPYAIISGKGRERFNRCKEAVDGYLAQQQNEWTP